MGEFIDFEHVKEHGDFEAILKNYNLDFTKNGSQLRVLCPFHDDTTPSLSITLVQTDQAMKNTFHCHGCGTDGSLMDFVADMEDQDDLREVARIIGSISNCTLAPGKRHGRSGRKSYRSKQNQTNGTEKPSQEAQDGRKRNSKGVGGLNMENGAKDADTGQNELPERNPVLKFALKLQGTHEYIETRIDTKTQKLFEVGYCLPSSKSMMAGKVCIPIHNERGELIAYAGRYPGDEVPKDAEKYKFPPNFHKLDVLFNLHRLGDTDCVMVVEGFFSTMLVHMLGVPVVGIMGNSMSEAQVRLLQERGIKRLLTALDGDAAGRNATPELISLLTRSFFVKVSSLPENEAPDTMSDKALQYLAAQLEL